MYFIQQPDKTEKQSCCSWVNKQHGPSQFPFTVVFLKMKSIHSTLVFPIFKLRTLTSFNYKFEMCIIFIKEYHTKNVEREKST